MLVRRALTISSSSLLLAALLAAPAAAGPGPRFRTERVWVDPIKDLAPDAIADNHISKTLYVNRCVGGCVLTSGPNDSRANTSSIVAGTSEVTEFAGSDADFNAVIACLRDVYGPYDVDIVTADPGTEVFHHEAILAGLPQEIGQGGGIGGIAPASCSPLNNVISFSFGNLYPDDIEQLCWTVAQESAHSFGLPNHAFDCSDPMTYLDGCGRKFFRNKALPCGTFAAEPCDCGVNGQNSHIELTTVFGAGTPPAATTVNIVTPSADEQVNDGFSVFFFLDNPRLVDHVDLYVNGIKYRTQAGHPYSQADNDYNFTAPELPDGYQDIEIKAYDDLGTEGVSQVTVLKGAPCANADSCFEYQECSDGRCTYPAPAGMVGDECLYEAYCIEGNCIEHDGERLCARTCNPSVAGSCTAGFECVPEGGCFPESSGGGCCSIAGGRKRDAFPLFALASFALGFLVIRRRR